MTKADDTRHFRERLAERFDIHLKASDMSEVLRLVRDGIIQRVARNGRERRLIKLHGKVITVVYIPGQDALVTVLPDTSLAPPAHRHRRKGRNRKRPPPTKKHREGKRPPRRGKVELDEDY